MVPPRGSRPRQRSTSRVTVWRSSTPRHPSRKPTTSSSYWRSPLRTTARMTALSPGQSPPPVNMPTRMRATLPAVPIVLAIDAGTTGVRAFAVDEAGQPVGWSYRELSQHYPHPGSVDHDPGEIWSAVQATLAELRTSLGDVPVAAIGVTNQRETAVAWDRRTGQALHPAIVWQDRRTPARCARLEADGHLPLARRATGPAPDPDL